mgnify:CR=1 FL=1
MGILGVESEFGRYKGSYNPLNAYISMMAEDYRYSFAEAQLIELLRFCKRTGLDIMSLQSSYAGAMSYAQFIPYSLNRWWKNSEGQGLYHMPDNIRSVANYLAHFGLYRDWSEVDFLPVGTSIGLLVEELIPE